MIIAGRAASGDFRVIAMPAEHAIGVAKTWRPVHGIKLFCTSCPCRIGAAHQVWNRRMPLNYVEGDATCPMGDGPKILVHVCNDVGRWGKGFVLGLSRRWKSPEQAFKAAFAAEANSMLGDVQFVQVADDLTVANLIGQRSIAGRHTKTPPVRYDAIRDGLDKVAVRACALGASVHMPRIGCGLAGGEWARVEPLIVETLCAADIVVTVYDFEPR